MHTIKVLFTAIGSIGTRHIRNLSKICDERNIQLIADAMRKTDRILPNDLSIIIRNQYYSFEEINEIYDIVFITDETAQHFESIKRLKSQCNHMFIEKPLFESTVHSLEEIKPDKSNVYYVAAPIRFTKYYQMLQQVISENKVFAARVIFSSYMPDWQKGRDYRKSFRTKQSLGGGVDIDSLHEIDYIISLFGTPEKVSRHAGHFSDLEMDACDIADYIFEYSDKLVQLQLDYFGRFNNRRVEMFCRDDVVICDFNKKELLFQRAGIAKYFGPDDNFYYDEMQYFLNLTTDPENYVNINPVEAAYHTLGIAKGQII